MAAKELILKQQKAKIEQKEEAQKQILDTKALNMELEKRVEEKYVTCGNLELESDRKAYLIALDKKELAKAESVLSDCLRVEAELKQGFTQRKEQVVLK